MTQTVVIVQRRLTHYRVGLFDALREKLRERGFSLELLVGEGTENEKAKQDCGKLSWATEVPTRYFLNNRVCWQQILKRTRHAALVVLPHENALLANHLLISFPRKCKSAFWGHGANFQSSCPSGLRERFKRWTLNKVDWWFGYTEMSKKVVCAAGFPPERVTVLDNAIDTTKLREQHASITSAEKTSLRHQLGFGGGPVGVFIGSLYADKHLAFLFESANAIHQADPSFRLLMIGDGPERQTVQRWCSQHSWTKWIGPKVGREKAAYLSLGHVMLNPGLVGLSILDSFACSLPLVTTDCGIHSPEVAYLENWRNGVITQNSRDEYVAAIMALLTEPRKLDDLRAGCAIGASRYTLANMVTRFADGIDVAVGSSMSPGIDRG